MSASIDAMIKEGVRLYKAGKKAEARAQWEKVTELDQYNEQAWLWLSAVVESAEDQRTCLENVLFINPNNVNAQKGLDTLRAKQKPTGSLPPVAAKPTPPAPPAPPPASPVREEPPQAPASRFEVPPTATSSSSSVFVPEEPAAEVYDDWIGSLNLGGNKSGSSSSSGSSSGPFSTPAFDDDSFDDDSFDTFSLTTNPSDDDDSYTIPKTTLTSSRTFVPDNKIDDIDFGGDDDDDDVFVSPFGDDPFADDDASLSSGPFSAAALSGSSMEDDLMDLRRSGTSSPASKSSAPSSSRGAAPSASGGRPAARPTGKSTAAGASAAASRSFIGDNVQPLDEPDPSVYFAMIPMKIQSTRLPGMDEKHPLLIRLMFILLLLANLGAAGLLVMRLMG